MKKDNKEFFSDIINTVVVIFRFIRAWSILNIKNFNTANEKLNILIYSQIG